MVEYALWSEQREKLVRKRVVISGKTVVIRMSDAEEVIALLTKELEAGAYVEPLDQPEPTTAPIDLKQNIGAIEAVDYYLETIQSSLSKASRRTYKTCGNTFLNYLKDKKLGKMKLRLIASPRCIVSPTT